MQAGTNAKLVKRWLREGWVVGNVEMVDECFHSDFVGHDTDYPVVGTEAIKAILPVAQAALADLAMTWGEILEEGDRAAVSWTIRARHVAPYFGIPPSGEVVEFHGSVIFRVVDGKFKEGWQTVDLSGMARAAGIGVAVPRPPEAPPPNWAQRWKLSARYVRVAQLMIEGLTDGEIALHLGLSVDTVRTYAREVLRAVGVSDRVQLARACGVSHVG